MAVSVIAYQMLIVQSHINIVESQTLQYQDTTGWHDFPINTGTVINLGNANMGAGNASTFFVQGINPNNRPIMYTLVIDSSYPEVKYEVACQSGTKYKIISGGEFNQGLTLEINNGAGLTSGLGITTIIDAGADITTGYPITPTTSVARAEVDSVDGWTTCE